MASIACFALQMRPRCKSSASDTTDHLKTSLSSTAQPFFKELQHLTMKIDVSKAIKNTSMNMVDAIVDSMFKFTSQPLLPSERNFAPVDEIGEARVEVACSEGKVPIDFPEGIFIRTGPNPVHGGLHSTTSIFGISNQILIEGEGMLHAVYFRRNAHGDGIISYKNKYVESKTFMQEKQRKKPSFLPVVVGDSSAILAAYILNLLRFGKVNKELSNTSVFEHAGKLYAVSENHLPQEIDCFTLETIGDWDVNGAWDRPFTSHSKKAPGTGELVIMGIDAIKPYFVVGVISADGKKLSHKVDLNFKRSIYSHEIGVTEKYNVIIDHPLTIDIRRLIKGGPLIKFEKGGSARIGVMPRYGNADSVQWFNVDLHCTFHLINTFEDHHEVVVRGCRAPGSIIPGPDWGENRAEWYSRGLMKPTEHVERNVDASTQNGFLFSRVYEWRLNMVTGEVKESYLTTGTDFSMDFPVFNVDFTGLKHQYGYTQVVDSMSTSSCGMPKYGGLAKLYFDEPHSSLSQKGGKSEKLIKVEYHKFAENNFCSGCVFVPKNGGVDEDDGWIVTFVHNEDTNVSQAHIIDAKNFGGEPVAIITLPQRVPYGFHGTFVPKPVSHSDYQMPSQPQ